MAKRSNGDTPSDEADVLEAFLAEIDARVATGDTLPLSALEAVDLGPTERMQVVVFTLSGGRYALDACYVCGVIHHPAIAAASDLPDWALGVVDVQGILVPVIDLAQFLEAGQMPSKSARDMLVVHVASQQVGLVVGDVELVYTFPAEHLVPLPTELAPQLAAYGRGAVEREGELICLLDCESLLYGRQPSSTDVAPVTV